MWDKRALPLPYSTSLELHGSMIASREQHGNDSTDSSNSKDDLTLWDFSPTLFWQQVVSDPQPKEVAVVAASVAYCQKKMSSL
jgi:hypothetical protein